MVAISGQLLEHGIGPAQGNQGIVSFYIRDNVHEFVNVARCNYMEYRKIGKN